LSLSATDFTTILTILEKIDRGLIKPRIPGRMGRYLRQYQIGRAQLDGVLAARGVDRRADFAVSGRKFSAVDVYPILAPQVGLLDFPLGEVARTLAISEALGGLTELVMWLKGGIANATYNLLRKSSGVLLHGDYRWNPPSRLTPGESSVSPCSVPLAWKDARCLKAVADDLIRPPHALEYILDYRLGPPGLKFFRSISARRHGREWEALPALGSARMLAVGRILPGAIVDVSGSNLAALLIYREPWSQAWTIAKSQMIDETGVFDHAIAWADFQRELDSSDISGSVLTGIRDSLGALGLEALAVREPNLTRQLQPVARDVLRWLRGST
jgi:hypothetical protein